MVMLGQQRWPQLYPWRLTKSVEHLSEQRSMFAIDVPWPKHLLYLGLVGTGISSLILWMDEILHHLRNPGMFDSL